MLLARRSGRLSWHVDTTSIAYSEIYMIPIRDGTTNNRLMLGLDVGGTKMLGAMTDESGVIVARIRRPTTTKGNKGIQQQIFGLLGDLLQAAPAGALAGIAIGVPGYVRSSTGVVVEATNIGVRNLPLGDIVAQQFNVPALVLHDVKAAALGEVHGGAGKGASHLAFFNVGTGISVGLVFDGQIYGGAAGRAGEIGHVSVWPDGPGCACGRRGCLEALVSGPALARDAQAAIRQGRRSSIAALVDGALDRITAETVAEAARQGDELALALLDAAAGYLGSAIAGLIMVLDLDRVVVGGGLAQIGPLLLHRVQSVVNANVFDEYLGNVAILPSALGADACVLGVLAAFNALNHTGTQDTKGTY